jgi:hypothetical protein
VQLAYQEHPKIRSYLNNHNRHVIG